jgi:hypothetical protein
MTRLDNDLISRKALLEAIKADRLTNASDAIYFIENAPTIEADSGESEPFTYLAFYSYEDGLERIEGFEEVDKTNSKGFPVYTLPKKQWVELTDGQIQEIFEVCKDEAIKSKVATNLILNFAKAYLAKLKEVNHG